MSHPRIVLSVVSHGQGALVQGLLGDIAAQGITDIYMLLTLNVPETLPFDINGYAFPIKIIRNERPQGFGANHNQAFRLILGQYFCVVNPDIRLTDAPFEKLVACLVESKAALVAPVVVNPQGGIEDSARRFPTPFRIAGKALGLGQGRDYHVATQPFSPDWTAGMFMLLQSDVFQELGGFDERYFLYYEDVDLCARLRLSGRDIVVCPWVTVIHAARRESHRNWQYLKWHVASITRFFCSSVFARLAVRRLLSKPSLILSSCAMIISVGVRESLP